MITISHRGLHQRLLQPNAESHIISQEAIGGTAMARGLLGILGFLGVLALSWGQLSAQEQAPTEQDLTLHPGDTITWSPTAVHAVQFGGDRVTPFSEVEKVLTDIRPPLTPDSDGIAIAESGEKVTATVANDAATSGVTEFNFTCGNHPDDMVTVPFKVAPGGGGQRPRDVQIVSANGPLRWVLKSPGDKTLAQP